MSRTFYVRDTSDLMLAKSTVLRQMRRLFRHAGVGCAEAMQRLAAALVTHVVEPGDVIFEQGSKGAQIYFVQTGVLELVYKAPSAANISANSASSPVLREALR